jgi:acyl-coenzyme A thioesterase PaaI-like protein
MSAQKMEHLKGYGDFTSPENKNGIPMEITATKDGVTATFKIPDFMSGWRAPQIVGAHPGAVDTVLSTATGWAAVRVTKRFALQKTVSVEYFDLVPVGAQLRCVGRVLRGRGEGEAVAVAEILDDKNEVLATSTATYALFTKDELAGKGPGPGVQFKSLAAGACNPNFLQMVSFPGP